MPRAVTSDENMMMPFSRLKRSAAALRADWLLREWISTMLKPRPPSRLGPKRVAR